MLNRNYFVESTLINQGSLVNECDWIFSNNKLCALLLFTGDVILGSSCCCLSRIWTKGSETTIRHAYGGEQEKGLTWMDRWGSLGWSSSSLEKYEFFKFKYQNKTSLGFQSEVGGFLLGL
jgi:hypothetical protein